MLNIQRSFYYGYLYLFCLDVSGHDDIGMFSDWFVVSVTVQREGEDDIHKFFVNSWVVGTLHVVEEGK